MIKSAPIKVMLKLMRMNMSLAIAFSAVAGYIFYSRRLDWGTLYVFVGVLLLSGAASALNQYQERDLDALMSRTKDRPLPAKEMSPRSAIVLTILLALLGSVILYYLTTPITAVLGLLNILWYNALYTPLKRKTPYVVLIGAVTGAVPPMMGWTAAGGYVLAPDIIFIASFMFLWQIPHFCLLLLRYRKDYEDAGFPALTASMDDKRVRSVVFVWIMATSVSTLFFPFFHIISSTFLTISLLLLNSIFVISFYRNTFGKNIIFNIRSAFGSLYLYQVIILIMLIVEGLW